MQTVNPGQTTILTASGLPTMAAVGFQVLKAATGAIVIARTMLGVLERPVGTGNYVITFVAPVEGDLYLVVVDWTGGVLAPETSQVIDLQVTTSVLAGSSGLGAIGDYVKMNIGGETWRGLTNSPDYGETFVARAIDIVKRRVMTTPPITADEDSLNPLVLDFLGICAALELTPAARDYWGSQHISTSTGNDPTETVTYTNRANLMDDLRDDLMRKLLAAQALAIPLIDTPLLRQAIDGPSIDEDDDCRSTEDPRKFPRARDFPVSADMADLYGYSLPRRSGVRL